MWPSCGSHLHVHHLTADSHLVAVDARTVEQAWESRLADYREGITHSSGAMVINGMVVSGRTCSPGSLEPRCFIAGHDADTGVERWRTYSAAGADDPGGETWGDLPTARRVHVSPWGLPGSYDPDLNRIFWGIAVPLPYPRIVRRGTWDVGDRTPCELYSNSTLAMNADTGAIDWYYQHLPCDDWDQDFVQERTLIDTVVDPDPEAVRWINPRLAGTAEERKVVVVMGEPGGLDPRQPDHRLPRYLCRRRAPVRHRPGRRRRQPTGQLRAGARGPGGQRPRARLSAARRVRRYRTSRRRRSIRRGRLCPGRWRCSIRSWPRSPR